MSLRGEQCEAAVVGFLVWTLAIAIALAAVLAPVALGFCLGRWTTWF